MKRTKEGVSAELAGTSGSWGAFPFVQGPYIRGPLNLPSLWVLPSYTSVTRGRWYTELWPRKHLESNLTWLWNHGWLTLLRIACSYILHQDHLRRQDWASFKGNLFFPQSFDFLLLRALRGSTEDLKTKSVFVVLPLKSSPGTSLVVQ